VQEIWALALESQCKRMKHIVDAEKMQLTSSVLTVSVGWHQEGPVALKTLHQNPVLSNQEGNH